MTLLHPETAISVHVNTATTLNRGWVTRAACQDAADPDLHFPGGREDSPAYRVQAEAARRVCGTCPVKTACLAWALTHEQHGIWGGTTPGERQELRDDVRTLRDVLAPAS